LPVRLATGAGCDSGAEIASCGVDSRVTKPSECQRRLVRSQSAGGLQPVDDYQ
jgi:hypothetical protein